MKRLTISVLASLLASEPAHAVQDDHLRIINKDTHL